MKSEDILSLTFMALMGILYFVGFIKIDQYHSIIGDTPMYFILAIFGYAIVILDVIEWGDEFITSTVRKGKRNLLKKRVE